MICKFRALAIPDMVGEMDLSGVPIHKRARLIINEVVELASRPSLKNLSARRARVDYMFTLLQVLSESQVEEALFLAGAETSPIVTDTTQRGLLDRELGERGRHDC